MNRELVLLYDTPATSHRHILETHNPYALNRFFDRIHITYWASDAMQEEFEEREMHVAFYAYRQPYTSSVLRGVRYMWWIARTLWRIVRRSADTSQFVFIAVMPLWPGIPALIVGRLTGSKVYVRLEAHRMEYIRKDAELHGGISPSTYGKLLLLEIIHHLTLPFFDDVIGISHGTVEEAQRYGAKRVWLVPVHPNLEQFFHLPQKIYSSMHQPVILFVGQVKKIKGVHILFKACHSLRKEDIFPKIIIAGDATNPVDQEYAEELHAMAKGLDVEFLGWVQHKELPAVYAQADIFVLPSYTEALGMVIMEAMAAGLPVVASDISGPRDLVQDEKTGFLIPKGNADQLKKRIQLLLDEAELRQRMGVQARRAIQEYEKRAQKAENAFFEKVFLS